MAVPSILTPAQFSAGTGGKVAADDPRLPALLDGVSAAVRAYCRWHVAPVLTHELVLDGRGARVLLLPTTHATAVTDVTVCGAALTADDYEWSASGMLRKRSGCWPDRYRSVTLTLEHGYDLADVPDLAEMVQQVAARAFASPMGSVREQVGPFASAASQVAPGVAGGVALMGHERALLDAYRLPGAA